MDVLTLFILLLATGEIAYSQRANIGSCEKLVKDDFGRSDTFSADGIVAEILQEDGMTSTVQVRIDGFKIVCEVAGLMKGTISSISVIIAYQYNTSLMSSPLNRTEQFQMDCVTSLNGNTASFSPPMILLGGGVHTLEPNGTLETQLNEKCGICADPVIIPNNRVEIDTHCFRMYTYNYKAPLTMEEPIYRNFQWIPLKIHPGRGGGRTKINSRAIACIYIIIHSSGISIFCLENSMERL